LNSQKQIIQAQNKIEMLKCQFAAHFCYNKGELLNYISWTLSIIGAVLVLLPVYDEKYALIIPLIVDFMTIIFRMTAKRNIKLAASLRSYFDDTVLGFHNPKFSTETVNMLWEKISIIESRHSKKCQRSIISTDQSEIPGMKDWYCFHKDCSTNEEAVFECQRQNYWWTEKEYRIRKYIYAVLTLSLYVALTVGFYSYPLKTIICLFGIIVNLYDDIRESKKCDKIMQSIETIINMQDIDKNPTQILALQSYIDSRRELLITEIDLIHRKNAKNWSTLYESIYNSQKK